MPGFKDTFQKLHDTVFGPSKTSEIFASLAQPKETARSRARAEKTKHIEIRPFQVHEWAQLKYLTLKQVTDVIPRMKCEDVSDDFWRQLIKSMDQGVIGAFENNEALAMGIISPSEKPGVATIGELWIEPKWRGYALTDRLFREGLEWLKRHTDIKYIEVSHVQGNLASKSANQRLGFTFIGEAPVADEGLLSFEKKDTVAKTYRLQVRP